MESLGHSIIESLVARLSAPAAFKLGETLGRLAYPFLKTRKQIILRNLRIAFAGEKNPRELEQLARATFRRSIGNLISATRTARLTPQQLPEVVTIENLHLLTNEINRGRGVVIILSHMGNWELLTRIVHFFPPGTKTGAFYRPLNNPYMNQQVLDRREADGTRMFSKRDNPLHVARFLRQGGIVGILADQRVGPQGEIVEFFGRVTRASPLPRLLARRSKSAMLALPVATTSPGCWTATFVPVEEPHDTTHAMRALETAMKRSPIDVFWLQDRWKVFVGRKRTISHWLETATGRKPHRILLWLAATRPQRPDDGWFHPDVTWDVLLDTGRTPPDWLPPHATIHQEPPLTNRSAVQTVLSRIDLSQALPVDLILTHGPADRALAKAAERAAIRILSLP